MGNAYETDHNAQVPSLKSRIVAKWYGTAVAAVEQALTKVDGSFTRPIDQHPMQKVLAAYDACSKDAQEGTPTAEIERMTAEMTGYPQELVIEQLTIARENFMRAAIALGANPKTLLPKTALLFEKR